MGKTIHIRQLDKLTVQYIRQRLQGSLAQLAEELKIQIGLGNCTLRPTNCRFQLHLAVLDSKGKPIQEEIEAFKHNAVLFGFEEADLGKEIVIQGKVCTIAGFNPKSQKRPVLAKSKDGKVHKFPCRVVLEALCRKVPDWI